MPLLLDVFLTFLKIGVVAFGGGYGMLPVITDECLAHGWLTSAEIMNFIAVSESTPGPIAINMATFIGASQCGFLGALLATVGVVLPSFIIILLIMTVLKKVLKYAGVNAFLDGVRPVVIGLIVATGIAMLITVLIGVSEVEKFNNATFEWKSLAIFLIVAASYFIYKTKKKKGLPAIVIIFGSAVLGIIFYGLIP